MPFYISMILMRWMMWDRTFPAKLVESIWEVSSIIISTLFRMSRKLGRSWWSLNSSRSRESWWMMIWVRVRRNPTPSDVSIVRNLLRWRRIWWLIWWFMKRTDHSNVIPASSDSNARTIGRNIWTLIRPSWNMCVQYAIVGSYRSAIWEATATTIRRNEVSCVP